MYIYIYIEENLGGDEGMQGSLGLSFLRLTEHFLHYFGNSRQGNSRGLRYIIRHRVRVQGLGPI